MFLSEENREKYGRAVSILHFKRHLRQAVRSQYTHSGKTTPQIRTPFPSLL